ncbi:hypothetical protein [Massilia sp. erpn]|uniref:hypothetical protein n=1 Tax=Massilia sp. erpn TaxID=2738142 RepID=UPI0021023C5A|nr:hypothetical protein [Massilia sp. erpn]UTY60403.1 hypothetical protein HPQ68_26345 [Massilia sp. erpn]
MKGNTMAIHMIGSRVPKGRPAGGWVDFVGLQDTPGSRGTASVYTFKIPSRWRKVILLGIGVGGSSGAMSGYTAGGGGGGSVKVGVVLPPNDVLTIVVPKSCVANTNDATWNNYQAPPLLIQSAALGNLIAATAGVNANTNTGGPGGIGTIYKNDFPVFAGGGFAGGTGMNYTGAYEGQSAAPGGGYSGGGGGGAHGNLGGAHGGFQVSPAFINSISAAKQISGSSTWNKTLIGGNSWSSSPIQDPCFGGGSGGTNGNPYMPGRAFARIAWGLSNDGGQIVAANTGW